MRLSLGFIFGILLCFCRPGSPAGLKSNPVKFFPELLNTVLVVDADGTRCKISTHKNYRKLCSVLLQQVGPSLPVDYNHSQKVNAGFAFRAFVRDKVLTWHPC